MVHILPHWTHHGKEGVSIPVVAYTNCDSVELFLNGASLGEQEYEDEQLLWHVPYQPGTLRAVGKVKGRTVAARQYRTAGKPAAVKATAGKNVIRANRTDVVHVEVDIVDGNGTTAPYAGNLVSFQIQGPARLIGVDNGDPLDLSPYKVNTRKAFRGKCLAIIQATGEGGEIRVQVKSERLISDIVTVQSVTSRSN
jgi:beta-galactosidase